jgi:hypothetical protein
MLPDYISPIHRPSTNPLFPIDARAGYEYGPWIDPSGQKLKVELWGKVREDWRNPEPVPGKGKEKEKACEPGEDAENEWRVLEEWNLDLGQLLPLSDDVRSHIEFVKYRLYVRLQLELPSNTLVVTLHPPGRTFYLPPAALNSDRRSPTPSADTGYASDPESGGRAAKKAGDPPSVQFSSESLALDVVALTRRRHRRGQGAANSERDHSKTTGWQDLFKSVVLQKKKKQ